MTGPVTRSGRSRSALTQALRAVRRARGLQVRDAAAAMGLALRTYSHFEGGGGHGVERLRDFARIMDCDYAALLLCAGGFNPALVSWSLENKAVSLAVLTVQEVYEQRAAGAPPLTAADLFTAFDTARRRRQAETAAQARTAPALSALPRATLTRRQLECLAWARDGKSSTDIGAILGISHRTVETHIAEACARLGVRTRVQAIARAIELGVLPPGPP